MEQFYKYDTYGDLRNAIERLVVEVVRAHCGDNIYLTSGTDKDGREYPTDLNAYNAFYDEDIGESLDTALFGMLAEAKLDGRAEGAGELQDDLKNLLGLGDTE